MTIKILKNKILIFPTYFDLSLLGKKIIVILNKHYLLLVKTTCSLFIFFKITFFDLNKKVLNLTKI